MTEDDEIEFIVDSSDVDDLEDASNLDEDYSDGEEDEAEGDTDTDDDEATSVEAALQPGAPLFLVQRGHQHAGMLPSVLKDIARRHADEMAVGVVASLPRMTPERIQSFFQTMEQTALRIADPEGFARHDSLGPTLEVQRDRPYVGVSTASRWGYFTADLPEGGTSEWVGEVVGVQREAGATLLLTPGLWADTATPQRSLEVARNHASWARDALEDDESLAVNLTLPATWLTTATLRDRLLNECVDMDESVFYMRVRWPLLGQSYGQLLDGGILGGYAEVANVFEENGKTLILPNTDLTGWVALAWGAHGFSTGIGAAERRFAETRVIRMAARPRPTPTQRTFTARILHVTDTQTSDRLDALPNAHPCRCRFCIKMRRMPGQFDKALAGAHYLRRVADLTARVATADAGRRPTLRRLVRAAQRFSDGAQTTVPLTGENAPRHLAEWRARLR